jgi:hypothetical protein
LVFEFSFFLNSFISNWSGNLKFCCRLTIYLTLPGQT